MFGFGQSNISGRRIKKNNKIFCVFLLFLTKKLAIFVCVNILKVIKKERKKGGTFCKSNLMGILLLICTDFGCL